MILARYRRAVSRSASAVSGISNRKSGAIKRGKGFNREFNGRTRFCHTVMTLRKVFAKQAITSAGFSTRLAQTGRCDTHGHGLAQDLDQHHDPTLTIGHLVDAFDAGKRCLSQAHALALLEQPLWLRLNRCLLRSQQFDLPADSVRCV